MAAEWFCKISGKEVGPLSSQQLKALVTKGTLAPEHRVRRGTEGGWVLAGRVKGLFPSDVPVAQPISKASETPPVTSPEPPPVPVAAKPAALGADEFNIVADASTSTARATGRSGAKIISSRKEQKNKALVIGSLVVIVVGLAVAGLVLTLRTSDSEQKPGKRAATVSRGGQQIVEEDLDDFDSDASEKVGAEGAEPGTSGPSGESADSGDKWVDASKSPSRRGDVEVKILSVTKGYPVFSRKLKSQSPPEKCLLLTVQLRNMDSARKVEYRSWSGRGAMRGRLRLTDNMKNTYRAKDFGRAIVKGQFTSKSIYADEPIEDLLIFERPVGRAEYLLLELPAAAFGQPGALYFKIPKEMIVETDQPQQGSEEEPGQEKDARPVLPADLESGRDGDAADDSGSEPEDADDQDHGGPRAIPGLEEG